MSTAVNEDRIATLEAQLKEARREKAASIKQVGQSVENGDIKVTPIKATTFNVIPKFEADGKTRAMETAPDGPNKGKLVPAILRKKNNRPKFQCHNRKMLVVQGPTKSGGT